MSNQFGYLNNTKMSYAEFLVCSNQFLELKNMNTHKLLELEYGIKDALYNTRVLKWMSEKNESIRLWADPTYRLDKFYERGREKGSDLSTVLISDEQSPVEGNLIFNKDEMSILDRRSRSYEIHVDTLSTLNTQAIKEDLKKLSTELQIDSLVFDQL